MNFFPLLVWSGPVSVRNFLEIFYFFTLVSSFLYPEMGKISRIITFLKWDHLLLENIYVDLTCD